MTDALQQQIKAYLATNPPGWCWEAKALALAESAQGTTLAVEIGVFGGRSLIPLALALQPPAFVWGIDPWHKEAALEALDPIADAAHIQWWSTVDLNAVHTRVAFDIWRLGLQERCGLLRTTGAAAVRLFVPFSIDLLHIDGCHVEAVACRDVQIWLPLCRPGAMVWMDDTNWSSTQKAVKLLEVQCEQLLVLPDPTTGSETRLYRKR